MSIHDGDGGEKELKDLTELKDSVNSINSIVYDDSVNSIDCVNSIVYDDCVDSVVYDDSVNLIDDWKKRIRVLFMDMEHCVIGLISKGSAAIFKAVWAVLSQTIQILRSMYYEEVLKAKLYTAFTVDTCHPITPIKKDI